MLKIRQRDPIEKQGEEGFAELRRPVLDGHPETKDQSQTLAPDEAARLAPAGWCFGSEEPDGF